MRVTGGEARGRRLKAPGSLLIRPTADRVREALFDILGARVHASRFLDVYAGTGAVGCEALSRGAARVVFLERQRGALRLIHANLGLAQWAGAWDVIEGEASASLRDLGRRSARFDVVFLDPPYDEPSLPGALRLAARLLDPAGLLILEHRTTTPLPVVAGLDAARTYRYGDTSLSVCRPVRESVVEHD